MDNETFGSGFQPPTGQPAPSGLPGAGPEAPLTGIPGWAPADGGEAPRVIRSVWLCLGLMIASLGLWGFAWVWHTSKEVTPRVDPNPSFSAGWRTGLLWVPILNWVIGYQCWRDISRFAERTGTGAFSAGGYLAGYIILGVLFGPLALIYPCIVQSKLNKTWQAVRPTPGIKAQLTKADWIPLGIGLALWVLLIAAIAIDSA